MENAPSSNLPQPTRSSPRKLAELSASASNARQHPGSMLPPPPMTGTKRKTLMERAAEPSRPAPHPPGSKINNGTKGSSLAGMARQGSVSSSTSTRPGSSASSRNTSNSSLAGSLSRPPSTSYHRPYSSMSSTSTSIQPPGSRNASALGNYPRSGRMLPPPEVEADNWQLQERMDQVESEMQEFRRTAASAQAESMAQKESLTVYKSRVNELEAAKSQLDSTAADRQREIERLRAELLGAQTRQDQVHQQLKLEQSSAQRALDDVKREFNNDLDDMERRHRKEMERVREDGEDEARKLKKKYENELEDLHKKFDREMENEKAERRKEVQELASTGFEVHQQNEQELQAKENIIDSLHGDVEQLRGELMKERDVIKDLRGKLADAAMNATTVASSMRSLQANVDFLRSDSQSQSRAFADLESQTQKAIREAEEAKSKLRTEETLRRKLHNQVQELKGNIRVFCRVRPPLAEEEAEHARIAFPDTELDAKELEVMGQEEKSSLGTVTTKKHAFAFDRVFVPGSQNAEVFDEISQLVQSALDGYNVCIFCYGQTGSGKTHTMSSSDGMIPRAVNQIYETARSLEEKGWTYTMEGSFVEVYNEAINDLLGKAEDLDRKEHKIRHDTERKRTAITDVVTAPLDSPGRVEAILKQAAANRSVAATRANERSSRSHSVFILRLQGTNGVTGEKSEGTLNLVDLAGSERLSHSGATGERLKETQNINKSLSSLGDVISALGQGKEGGHVPYRNSKLTHLLQYSLGSNSKTLMFVMVSPLMAHLSETLTSLKFATKVHNTHIGTAKKQTKVRE